MSKELQALVDKLDDQWVAYAPTEADQCEAAEFFESEETDRKAAEEYHESMLTIRELAA